MRFNYGGPSGGEPSSTDPQKMTEAEWAMLTFEGLMAFDKEQRAIPAAAEKLEVSPDGLTYTATLRDGLEYSDGVPLTAHNFEYAFRRLFDPRVKGRDYASVAYVIAGAQQLSEFQNVTDTVKLQQLQAALGVHAADDKHIEFTLSHPAGYFPAILALWVGYPTREDMVEQGGANWTEPATYIGNGPFILKQWNHGSDAIWVANPLYRKGRPKIDRLEAHFIQEPEVTLQAYKNGELDWIPVGPAQMAEVQSDPVLRGQLLLSPGQCSDWLAFNSHKEPFDNLAVRQSFLQAIDRDDWVATFGGGLNKKAINFIPEGLPGYEPDVRQAEFDPSAARAALAAAIKTSYPAGLPAIKLTYGGGSKMATFMSWMQDQFLTNLGVNVALEPVDEKVFDALLNSPATAPQLVYGGWCQDYPDPQDWLSLVFRSDSALNYLGWQNKQFDELTRQADGEQDATTRRLLYKQAQQILIADVPAVFMSYSRSAYLVKPYMKGMRENSSPADGNIPGATDLTSIDLAR